MSEQSTQQQVPILAALAQATRLEILSRVAETGARGMPAGDIARSVRCPASTLSFHLKELHRTGILEARPRGRYIIYSLQREALASLARYLVALAGPEPGSVQRRKTRATRTSRKRQAGDRGQLSMFGD